MRGGGAHSCCSTGVEVREQVSRVKLFPLLRPCKSMKLQVSGLVSNNFTHRTIIPVLDATLLNYLMIQKPSSQNQREEEVKSLVWIF